MSCGRFWPWKRIFFNASARKCLSGSVNLGMNILWAILESDITHVSISVSQFSNISVDQISIYQT